MKVAAIVIFVLAVAVGGVVDAAAPVKRDISKKRAKYVVDIAAQGGIVSEEYKGNVIRIASVQGVVSLATLKAIAGDIQKSISIPVLVDELGDDSDNVKLAKRCFDLGRTGAAVFVVDRVGEPSLMVAPEDSWAVVNVRNLLSDGKRDKLDRRVRQELWRALAYALNGTDSQMQPCLMTTVRSVGNLDSNPLEVLSPEPLFKMQDGCAARNMRPARRGTYRRACEQGWAPAPTNDVQKAIWAEVNALPTKPITIKYDKKKKE